MLFYGLPLFPRHYPELVNLVALGAGAAVSVTALYARQDLLALERVVGSARARRMLDADPASGEDEVEGGGGGGGGGMGAEEEEGDGGRCSPIAPRSPRRVAVVGGSGLAQGVKLR